MLIPEPKNEVQLPDVEIRCARRIADIDPGLVVTCLQAEIAVHVKSYADAAIVGDRKKSQLPPRLPARVLVKSWASAGPGTIAPIATTTSTTIIILTGVRMTVLL